jgi:hypothetical protein
MDMKYVVREYIESTQLVQNNVDCNEFSVSIKAGVMKINFYRDFRNFF